MIYEVGCKELFAPMYDDPITRNERVSELTLREPFDVLQRNVIGDTIWFQGFGVHYNLPGWVEKKDLEPARCSAGDWWADQATRRGQAPYKIARELFLDLPYCWGGSGSSDGIDCSGIVAMAYRLTGIQIPRDSDQQEFFGQTLAQESDLRQGDLITYGRQGKATHIAFFVKWAERQAIILHANGTETMKVEEVHESRRLQSIRRRFIRIPF
ncbi:MAG TPA: NlpC/P60 family protein [Candidatus Saccharimonadales bacterium]|jgi:hypothetical protein|nr:NlpC/P60 family protein [Candidatus Saccharimonadales bacterium]